MYPPSYACCQQPQSPPLMHSGYHQPPVYPWYRNVHGPAWGVPYYEPAWGAIGQVHDKAHMTYPPMLGPRVIQPTSVMGLQVAPSEQRQPHAATFQQPPLPSSPRGPPCKPKQSGWAVWVGNLPPSTTVIQLKDFFATEATDDIESVFLITKTNCAFVNYKTETACQAAIKRFDSRQFRGNRLVCRTRRDSTIINRPGTSAAPSQSDVPSLSDGTSSSPHSGSSSETIDTPLIVESNNKHKNPPTDPAFTSIQSAADFLSGLEGLSMRTKVKNRMFILKSLTLQDLLVSTRDGAWQTQPHNEKKLNDAFRTAENVYLLFSVNKAGQYFGYARMESLIPVGNPTTSRKALGLNMGSNEGASQMNDVPISIPTQPTATAPAGRVMDDSARGTIFWEAQQRGEDKEDKDMSMGDGGVGGGGGAKQFAIQWISTVQVPFHATRGLRNPLNANREVKIARDGTELDAWVGERLLQLFHPRGGPPG